jgi:hypothetical protein
MKITGLQILAEELVESGFLLETRAPFARRAGRELAIEVGNTQPLDAAEAYLENSITHYLESMRQDRLSWLLFDGSIVQVSYRLSRDVITYHRYCYIPAPFEIDLRSSSGADLVEWIESASSSDPLNIPRRSSMRFEYDHSAHTDQHAAAHLHLNSPDCRIPMRGPLSVREFISFVAKFLYPNTFAPDLCGRVTFEYHSTITDLEEKVST